LASIFPFNVDQGKGEKLSQGKMLLNSMPVGLGLEGEVLGETGQRLREVNCAHLKGSPDEN